MPVFTLARTAAFRNRLQKVVSHLYISLQRGRSDPSRMGKLIREVIQQLPDRSDTGNKYTGYCIIMTMVFAPLVSHEENILS